MLEKLRQRFADKADITRQIEREGTIYAQTAKKLVCDNGLNRPVERFISFNTGFFPTMRDDFFYLHYNACGIAEAKKARASSDRYIARWQDLPETHRRAVSGIGADVDAETMEKRFREKQIETLEKRDLTLEADMLALMHEIECFGADMLQEQPPVRKTQADFERIAKENLQREIRALQNGVIDIVCRHVDDVLDDFAHVRDDPAFAKLTARAIRSGKGQTALDFWQSVNALPDFRPYARLVTPAARPPRGGIHVDSPQIEWGPQPALIPIPVKNRIL